MSLIPKKATHFFGKKACHSEKAKLNHRSPRSVSKRKFIESGPGLPNWTNPISHAVVVNNMCFVSGQLSVNEEGEYLPGTASEEARLAFKNVFAALSAAGFDKSEIAYVDIAFSDLSDLEAVNQVYVATFPKGKRPARTVYQAARLPFDGKIKVVATAVKELME